MEYTIEKGALVTLFQNALVILFFAAPTRLYWYDDIYFQLSTYFINFLVCAGFLSISMLPKCTPTHSVGHPFLSSLLPI